MGRLRQSSARTCLAVVGSLALVSAALLSSPALAATTATACAICGHNLINNPGAEAGPGAQADTVVVVPGWTKTEGSFTAASYAWSGGDLSTKTPGPPDRGENYFYGGPDAAVSVGSQTISLEAGTTEIDRGALTATLAGWLGGYAGQADDAALSAIFRSATGQKLKTLVIGPVTPAERNNESGLVERSVATTVPVGATSVAVILVMTRYSGSDNDGLADNLSLVLSPALAVPPAPTNLQAAPGDGEVGLTWSDVPRDASGPVTGYTVLWRTGTPSVAASRTVGDNATSYTATGLTNGDAYEFAVEAVNHSGAGPATPWASVTPSSSSPPLAPGNLTARLSATGPDYLGLHEVKLSWSAPPPGECPETLHIKCTLRGYELGYDYSVTSDGTPRHVELAVGAGATTATTQPLLLNLSLDKFRLDAKNGNGTGPGAQVEVLLEVAPPAPAVTAVPGPGQVSLSWVQNVTGDLRTGVGGITAHEIYEGDSLSPLLASQFTVQASVQTQGGNTVATITATVTGLANLRTYYFKVANLDAAGLSPPSAQVSAATPGLPGAPLDFTAHRGNREVFLTWQPPTSLGGTPITSYDVYMGTSPGAESTSAVASTAATAALVRPGPATISNGTKYYFTVKALNAVGPGPASSEVSATPEGVPGPPGDLVATAGPGSVKLSWAVPSSPGDSAITGYDLYEGTSPGAESATPVQLPATPTDHTVSGLTAGTAYYFYIVAGNTEGSGLSSDEVYATPTPVLYPPGVPLDLAAHRGNREVFLTWQPPASDGGSPVTGYDVYMGTAPGAESPNAVASTSGTAALVRPDPATITNGTKYYFTVKAVNAIGTSPASSEVSATPEAVPGPPADLVATAANGSVKLTWLAPVSQGGSPVTGYDLYQGGSPEGESTTPVTLPASPTSYTVTGLTSTVAYYFTLAAVNPSGVGLPSGEVSAIPTGAPGAPSDLKATPGDEQVGLSWSTPFHNGGAAITGYTVLWRKGTSSTPTAVPLGATQTTYTVPGLTNGTAYQFAVEATNSSGTGPATAWADASPTFDAPPLAPGDLTGTDSLAGFSDGDITLRWSKPPVAGCPGYGNDCSLSGYDLSYDFYVTTSTGTTPEHFAERLSASATSYVVQLPLNFSRETFSLVAINGYGAGPAAQVKVLLEVVPKAPAVSAAPGTEQVSLSWIEDNDLDLRKGIGPITGFEIYSGTAPGSETGPLGGSQITSTSTTAGRLTTVTATVTLPNVTKYYFKVALTDAAGSGPASGEVSATPSGSS